MVVSRAMDENIFLFYRALKRPRWKGREKEKKREAVQEMRAKEGRTANICIPSRLERERELVERRRRKYTNTYIVPERCTQGDPDIQY